MKQFFNNKLFILMLLPLVNASISLGAASINLDQARNGSDASPTNPITWVNGNANSSQAHYKEGMSIPYRAVMTGLTIGTQITITIGYDIKSNSKHAIDFLTHYDNLLPHNFTYHSTAETIDPTASSGVTISTVTIYPIPAPSSVGSPVSGQPTTRFNSLSESSKYMTAYNGTIDDLSYGTQGSLTASSSETEVIIKFTPSSTSAIIAWGGHIASRSDWGYSSGSPLSAGGISGSPFHMRLKSWSLGSVGSQDRSVSGASIPGDAYLPVELLSFEANSVGTVTELSWSTGSEVNSSYFAIEKTSSPSEFVEELTQIPAAGNATTIRNYEFTDPSPYYPVTYYRLRQVDNDGTPHFTKFIASYSESFNIVKTLIYNMQGQIIKIVEGRKMDALDLPTGQYLFYYVGEDGNVSKKNLMVSPQ